MKLYRTVNADTLTECYHDCEGDVFYLPTYELSPEVPVDGRY